MAQLPDDPGLCLITRSNPLVVVPIDDVVSLSTPGSEKICAPHPQGVSKYVFIEGRSFPLVESTAIIQNTPHGSPFVKLELPTVSTDTANYHNKAKSHSSDPALGSCDDKIIQQIRFPSNITRKSKALYDVCVVGGLGHVGLPLGISFARSGRKVVLYDIDKTALECLSQGKMPFKEDGAEEILPPLLKRNLTATDEKSVISQSRFIVIVIGTPVDEHLNPGFNTFIRFLDGIIDFLHDDQHLILRSTVYPGTTEKVRQYLHSHGKHPRVSFCPERIAQGQALQELKNLPQIIASFDEPSLTEVKELFSSLTDDILTLTPSEAELAKLFCNVWRYIHFAVSNQFYQIATRHNLDFYRIYHALKYNYPRLQGFSTAGLAAGPCLFKDTMQLAAFSNNSFFLGHSAMLINEGMPNFIVQRLKDKYPLGDLKVGILGMAFKADNDDKRESLSYKLKKIFEIEAHQVFCSDVYLDEPGFIPPEELVRLADIIILAAPHSQYKQLDIDSDKILVDIWNFFGRGGDF